MNEIKKNGVFYTPSKLAEYLVTPLINGKCGDIFDPSYGEGALLLAAKNIAKNYNKKIDIDFYGCDIHPVNNSLKELKDFHLYELDFFHYDSRIKFNTIVMNPPYVRHHLQDIKKIQEYRETVAELSILNNKSDLWAFFLIKACSHLKSNGNIGAILPWSLLQADYAKPLRKWLLESFSTIKIAGFNHNFFENTDERIIVVWLKGFGKKNNSIKVSISKNIDEEMKFSNISEKTWLSNIVPLGGDNKFSLLVNEFAKKYRFNPLSSYADVKIGVVTGAVDYFITPYDKALENKIEERCLVPILTKSTEFTEYIKFGTKNLKQLIKLNSEDYERNQDFINKGLKLGYHLRRHSTLREPWYSVRLGEIPNAFFHYRISKIPYLLPNTHLIQCTNSIHRIYYKNLSDIEIKWITVSVLTSISQLSIEMNSKVYGNGVLKIEPSSLKKVLVFTSSSMEINLCYEKIMDYLSLGRKEDACKIASDFIYKYLGIPTSLVNAIDEALYTYRKSRS